MDNKRQPLIEKYQAVRRKTEALCAPLSIEDYLIQSSNDVSPPKWHLAHTSWFFETFILIPSLANYVCYDPLYAYLFNSYYNGVGNYYPRYKRGLIARPSVEAIYAYRNYIDKSMLDFLASRTQQQFDTMASLVELGLHHEQQHQELLLMDIKHNFYIQPSQPAYQNESMISASNKPPQLKFEYIEGGTTHIGYAEQDFCYDVELPLHQKLLMPYWIANRLVTNGEYAEFIESGAYDDPRWWLVDGWAAIKQEAWTAPLYWVKSDNYWYQFTLQGMKKLVEHEPVSHVSYYEADAYAAWRNKRLIDEVEWENTVKSKKIATEHGNFLEQNFLQPQGFLTANTHHAQLFGDVWEWTASAYSGYPGYKPLTGVIGEYNGKFMNNQKVLRGGSCVTPVSHIRSSYRNYFQPEKRWQFSGIRLASNKEELS